MGDKPKFHRWEFRRRDIHVDSSSVESNSSAKPLLKEHKIIPSLISLENDQNVDSNKLRQYGNRDSDNGDQTKNERTGKKQKAASRRKKVGEKKCKASAIEPTTQNNVKIFMESLLDDLKITREKIFESMREEIGKLVADDINMQPGREGDGSKGENVQIHNNNLHGNLQLHHQDDFKQNVEVRRQRKIEENVQVQHQNNVEETDPLEDETIERSSTKNPEKNGSTDCYQSCKDKVDCREAAINPKFQFSPGDQYLRMQRRNFPSAARAQNCIDGSNTSSTYLTLNEPLVQKHKLNALLCNNVQPMVFENKVRVHSERANRLLDSSSHHGYLSGIPQAGISGKLAQTSSRSTGYFDRNGGLWSDIRVGFPVPLHQATSTSFNIARHVNLESLPQEKYHKLNLSVNGGATSQKTDQL